MSEIDSSLIYQGFWVNHERGSILGATITANQNVSNILVAVLAIIVSMAVGSLWSICLFILHQARTTAEPRDGLFRQQQVLIRTLSTPGNIAIESLKMLNVWRYSGAKAALRCLILAVFGIAFVATSLAAAAMVSYVISTQNLQVLVQSAGCRDYNMTAYLDPDIHAEGYLRILDPLALSFAEKCYAAGPVPSSCNFYVHPRIQPSITYQPCSFDSTMCLNKATQAIVLDTGYLDSNDIFGINAPLRDRVRLRRKATCAPLNAAKHTHIWNVSDPRILPNFAGETPLPGEEVWVFSYGQLPDFGMPENGTLLHSTYLSNRTYTFSAGTGTYYSSEDANVLSTFIPIDGLQQAESDIILISISFNALVFSAPSDDPVYSVHAPASFFDNAGTIDKGFAADHPSGALGCTAQYQFCVVNSTGDQDCTSFRGATTTGWADILPSVNDAQLATLNVLGGATVFNGYSDAILASPPFLDSISKVYANTVGKIPADQWTLDVQKLESFALAVMQVFTVMHATGYSEEQDPYLSMPSTSSSQQLCRNQKVIKPGGFANINVFGLAFTVAIAGVLFIIDFIIIRFLILTHDVRTKVSPKLGYWFEDGIYQLQRVAYEAYSSALWGRIDNEVPHTGENEMLKNLASYIDGAGFTVAHHSASAVATGSPLALGFDVKAPTSSTVAAGTPASDDEILAAVPIPPPYSHHTS